MKKYIVDLSKPERSMLEEMISVGKGSGRLRQRAQILLLADEGPDGARMTDKEISNLLPVGVRAIERIRRQLIEEGLQATISRKRYDASKRTIKIDGDAEAQLVALCCGEAPKGRSRWTIRLLADKLVEMNIEASRETVRRTLKKMNLSLG